jgi:hypothetical protein
VVKIVNSGGALLVLLPTTSLKGVRPALDRTVHETFAFTYHLHRTFFFFPFVFVISNLAVLSTQVEVGDPTGAGVEVVTGAGVEVVTGAGVGAGVEVVTGAGVGAGVEVVTGAGVGTGVGAGVGTGVGVVLSSTQSLGIEYVVESDTVLLAAVPE